jgi:hypothetical protein
MVNEVRWKFHAMMPTSQTPFRSASPEFPISEIIERTKPPADTDELLRHRRVAR